MLFESLLEQLLFENIFLSVAVLGAAGAAIAARLRLSPWWLLPPGVIAAVFAALLYSPISTCQESQAEGKAFGGAVLATSALFAAMALKGLIDVVRLGRTGEARRAARRLIPFLLGTVLAVGALFLALLAYINCLA